VTTPIRIACVSLALIAQQLPPPLQTPWFRRPTTVVEMPAGRQLALPRGFAIELFAGELEHARFMALAPGGDVFIAESRRGLVTALRDQDGDGRADVRATFLEGLNRPFGLAFLSGHLYVGTNDALVRVPYAAGQLTATAAPEVIAALPPSDRAIDRATAERLGIPLSQTRGYNHWTRNVIANPAGTKLYVTVGSATNATPDDDPERAAILEMNPDGTGRRVFAGGLRNPVGLAFYPGTSTLWTAVNERDQLGDDVPPDFITSVQDGGFYGWPYSYIGRHVDPTVTPQRPDLVGRALSPDVLLPAHSAALGVLFYRGTQFPAEYRHSVFVALHGSINRSRLSGYEVVRVPFANGRPSGPAESFISGFIVRDDADKAVWGRPVGLLELPDGSLLVSDDGGNVIWRVRYAG
jgi:glucose/arabinose dehydrogenase